MTGSDRFPRGVPFQPSPAFVSWFIIDFLLLVVLILLCMVVPLYSSEAFDTGIGLMILAGVVVITIVFAVWTRLYYDMMAYELHDDELRWRRGVWFRTTGIVPYNRITNLDLRQGPVMRWLGISTIAIQTAGYSGQAVPEIRIEAIEYADELREILRSSVRSCSSAGDGTGTGTRPPQASSGPVATTGTSTLILDELRKIRVILEEQKK